MNAAQKIEYLMENNNLSINELAEASDIDVSELENMQGDSYILSEALLEKMAIIFQVPLSFLQEDSVQESNSMNYLTRAIEKLSKNDHDELVQFAEFLQSVPKEG